MIYGTFKPTELRDLHIRGGWGRDNEKSDFIRVALEKGFGPSREQVYTKKRARHFIIGPGKLYNQMRQFYADTLYFDAAAVCGRILTEYPDFFKNDWVHYYCAWSLEKLDFRRAASESVHNFIASKENSHADIVLRDLYFNNNNFRIKQVYQNIINSSASDSLKDESHLILGEYYLRNRKTETAQNIFRKIPADSYYYKEAQKKIKISKYLNKSEETYGVKDSVLLEKYHNEREEYELLGMKFYEYLSANNSSHVVEVLNEIKEQAAPYYQIVKQYEKAWSEEQDRIAALHDQTD